MTPFHVLRTASRSFAVHAGASSGSSHSRVAAARAGALLVVSRAIVRSCIWLACIAAANAPAHAQGGTIYKVFYLGGQSNMEGFGYVDELPDSLRGGMEEVRIFHGNTAEDGATVDGRGIWAPLQPGHGRGFSSDGRSNTYSDRFGPELAFAARLREHFPMDHIALIKYARGGTSIDTLVHGNGTWDPDYASGGGINQYDHFLATLRHAFQEGDIDGDGLVDTLVPAGIVWMQGESDAAYTVEAARRYGDHLTRLMALMRAAMRVDDLPVVIGRISDSGQAEDGLVWPHGGIVRESQATFARRDARAELVTSTDEYGYSDRWHYDTRGYIDLGTKFADAYVRILRKEP